MKACEADTESWMRDTTYEELRKLQKRHVSGHQLRHKAFRSYQFQLSGKVPCLRKLIELPLLSIIEQSSGSSSSCSSAYLRQLFEELFEQLI